MTSRPASPTATHAILPGSQWALWRTAVLRAPGFPADGIDLLASPALAGAADDLATHDDDATARAARAARYRVAFEAETQRLSARIMTLLADQRLALALAWQNHQIVDTVIASMLRNLDGGHVRRNVRQRQREELVASYWQRYCVKNETIGFFGPVGWARLDPAASLTRLDQGAALIAHSQVFFETWAIDRLADAIATDPGMAEWVAPRKRSFVRVDGRRAIGPDGRSEALTAAEAAVLRRCTGTAPAREIALELAGRRPGMATPADVYEVIARLCGRRLATWKLELALSPRPEHDLRRFLRQVGDPALAASGLERLDRLEIARDAAWATAREGDATRFVAALRDLDRVFTTITGAAPNRGSGQAYAGRTLIYHDARRDVRLDLGADFLDALAPLGLVLDSARWLTYQFAGRLTTILDDVANQLAVAGAPVDLASFWFACMPVIRRSAPAIVAELQGDFQRRWARILKIPAGAPRVRRAAAQVRDLVRAAFAAPHSGWSAGRYCSPDIMIAASGLDAIHGGDFELVLGECHLAVPSIRHNCFVSQHPSPREIFDCLAVDSPGPRLLPVLPKKSGSRLTIRSHSGLTRDEDYLVALAEQTAEPGRPRLLHAADLLVTPARGGPTVAVPEGPAFPVIDVFTEMITDYVLNALDILPPSAHQPRVTVDRLVIARESWRFDANGIGFAALPDEADRFAAARRWQRAEMLPRHVFAKVHDEVKPLFVDFESVPSVNLLARSVRRLQAQPDGGPGGLVRVSEMLPSADQLWLVDGAGHRYTCELRLVAVDQQDLAAGPGA